jgi:hypothetical protein
VRAILAGLGEPAPARQRQAVGAVTLIVEAGQVKAGQRLAQQLAMARRGFARPKTVEIADDRRRLAAEFSQRRAATLMDRRK